MWCEQGVNIFLFFYRWVLFRNQRALRQMQGLVGGKQGGPIDYCLKRVSAIIAVAELLNATRARASEYTGTTLGTNRVHRQQRQQHPN